MSSGSNTSSMMPRLTTVLFERLQTFFTGVKNSRVTVLCIVLYSNMLDSLLLTSVVPIIPEVLLDLDKESLQKSLADNGTCFLMEENETSTPVNFGGSAKSKNVTHLGFAHKILQISFSALDENSRVGWLLSSKALVQLFANPVVGTLCNRLGYSIILFSGTNVLLVSSLLYSVAGSFAPLLMARCCQGVGSAAVQIAGMCLLAERYPVDKERSKAMGIAMGGSALGVVVGYPFGGFMYTYTGKIATFVVLSAFIAVDLVAQLVLLCPSLREKASKESSPLHQLLRDPYILVASGTVMVTTVSMAALEPTVPIWIIDTMHAAKWQLGLVFLPDSIGYLVGTNFFGVPARTLGRWICSLCCMLLIGLCLVCIPFATSVTQLILPHFGLGLGLGIVDASIVPLLALLVDTRHVAAYGSVYAINQLAVCLAYGLGPSIAGQIVKFVGFSWLMWGLAILHVVYSPLCILLKNPPIDEEHKPILGEFADGSYEEY